MSYLARITECKHGYIYPHWKIGMAVDCPGGTTTRIEPDYEAAAIAWENQFDDMEEDGVNVHSIVDAALGGSE